MICAPLPRKGRDGGLHYTVSLNKNYEFQRLYDKGRSAVTPTLVFYMRRSRRDINRVGFTVTKRVGKAVMRNKVRRRLREIYRLHESELRTGFDLVVVARGRSADADYAHLEKDFQICCQRLSLLRESSPET